MLQSDKIVVQKISDILQSFEVEDIVLSPGSRNAPFILQFTHNPFFSCYSIPDERSAGFFALGIAQAKQKPVVVCCTSGSAVVNYYPAITEAFYKNIPLIILTADRPHEIIDQFEGQTIRQDKVFENHTVGSMNCSDKDFNINLLQQLVGECFSTSAPIHINVGFDEPLYHVIHKEPEDIDVDVPDRIKIPYDIQEIQSIWESHPKKMILLGNLFPNENINQLIDTLSQDPSVIILSENHCNYKGGNAIHHIDRNIDSFTHQETTTFSPDVLLTVGQNVISKKIKQFLRDASISYHIHIDEYWTPDTYLHLTHPIQDHKQKFLELVSQFDVVSSDYQSVWMNRAKAIQHQHQSFIKDVPFSDLQVFHFLEQHIPDDTVLHFSNSSAIRYSQLFDFMNHTVFANRGVSGIDGSTSTAIGMAVASTQNHILITGDISFLYDSNALWNNHISTNIKIIIINNGGGDIFNIIPGPSSDSLSHNFFITPHSVSIKSLVSAYGLVYYYADNSNTLIEIFQDFLEDDTRAVLEINTSLQNNADVLKNYFRNLQSI